jgi:hypothetical protein
MFELRFCGMLVASVDDPGELTPAEVGQLMDPEFDPDMKSFYTLNIPERGEKFSVGELVNTGNGNGEIGTVVSSRKVNGQFIYVVAMIKWDGYHGCSSECLVPVPEEDLEVHMGYGFEPCDELALEVK